MSIDSIVVLAIVVAIIILFIVALKKKMNRQGIRRNSHEPGAYA